MIKELGVVSRLVMVGGRVGGGREVDVCWG